MPAFWGMKIAADLIDGLISLSGLEGWVGRGLCRIPTLVLGYLPFVIKQEARLDRERCMSPAKLHPNLALVS